MATILINLLNLCIQLHVYPPEVNYCKDFMMKCVNREYSQQHGDVSNDCFKQYVESKK